MSRLLLSGPFLSLIPARMGRAPFHLIKDKGGSSGPLVVPKSQSGQAVAYALKNWTALTRYCGDGDLEIDQQRHRAFSAGLGDRTKQLDVLWQ